MWYIFQIFTLLEKTVSIMHFMFLNSSVNVVVVVKNFQLMS